MSKSNKPEQANEVNAKRLGLIVEQEARRFFSEAQLKPDPALVAAGWQPRFIADARQTNEVTELYNELGFEVRAEPVPVEQMGDECSDCQALVLLQFSTIYTRKKGGTMFQTIDFQVDGPVARLTLNRPPLNIINIPMMGEMVAALESLRDQPAVRALVIDAIEGSKAFSAGVDVADHTAATVHDMITGFHTALRLMAELNIPTLAVVDGAALGGGCELAMFCDMIVASERAKFGQPEIKVGVFPPVAVGILARLIPEHIALEMLLTGDSIDATEAYRLGLVNRLVPADELAAATAELVGKVTRLSGSGLRYTRRAARLGASGPFLEVLPAIEQLYLEELMQTQDAHEGLAAFLEKRSPLWQDK